MSANRNCAFFCLVAIVCGFVRTCHAQAYAATPDPDAPFKLLTQKWGQALADLTVTVLAHNGTNNSSGIYLGILLSLWGDKNALAFESQKDPPISGERCLELMTVFVQDFANATLHQNDPIVGTVVLPLQGEQLYQTQLQNFGKGLQSFYDAAAANANTPNPGKWLDFILRTVRDINLAKQVVANHDTSPKCLALAKVLGQEALETLNSLDQ